MRIYGLDFTSAPSKRKPLMLAHGRLLDGELTISQVERIPTFTGFEQFLISDGPWVAGLDFAFGQPRKLLENLSFPLDWHAYVELIESMGKREWVRTIDRYMHPRPKGDKLHFRPTDRLAGAQSPMKMYFIPVGRMFFEGARRLAASPVSVLPNRPTNDNRVVLEVYPALVVRQFLGRGSKYKSDDPAKQTPDATRKRQLVLNGLQQHSPDIYGFRVRLAPAMMQGLLQDASGDALDAVLAAVQAAWGYTQRGQNYGIPANVSPLEGWIVDPYLLEKYDA